MNIEQLESRIREIHDSIGLLEDFTEDGYESLNLADRLAVRYLVIELVEAAGGVCIHLLHESGETSEGFPDCFQRMGEREMIPGDLARRLSSAARLRNLLVHRYCAIDDERVYDAVCEGLGDFKEFVRYIREIIEEAEGC